MLFTYDLVLTMVWIVALMAWTFMFIRYKTNKMNMRERIVTALIEKNPDADIDELLKGVAPKQKLLKEKLLSKLLRGCIFTFLGFGIFGCAFWIDCCGGANPDHLFMVYSVGGILYAIGLAFIIYYFVGKKVLAKELEAEEKKMMAEANL